MIYKQDTPNFNNIFIKLMKTICNNQINNKDTPQSENKDFVSVYVELLTDDKGIASFSIDFPKKILIIGQTNPHNYYDFTTHKNHWVESL